MDEKKITDLAGKLADKVISEIATEEFDYQYLSNLIYIAIFNSKK